MVSHDRVLTRADPERDVLVSDAPHHGREIGRLGIDQGHGKCDDRGGEGPRLLTVRLVRPVEDPEKLGVRREHPRIEQSSDLLGVLGDHTGGGANDGLGFW